MTTQHRSSWDLAISLRPHEAACLIAGTPMPQSPNPTKDELPADARPVLTTILMAFVMGLKYKAGDPVDENYPVEMTLTSVELGSGGAIRNARFRREELHRWLNATGWHSEYSFAPAPEPAATAQTAASPAPVAPSASDATVVTETTEQRRVRWLDWYGKGERGAVQRVFKRELLRNPKADRSFIGKEIKKAEQEKQQSRPSGYMVSQLVQSGKRPR